MRIELEIEVHNLLKRISSPRERLLADLELLKEVRQQLAESFVANAAVDDVRRLVRLLHDLHPRLVDVRESLGFLKPENIYV